MNSKYDVHACIVRDVVGPDADEDCYLALMLPFHTHRIQLSPAVKLRDVDTGDSETGATIVPLTRSHAAEIMASCALPYRSAEKWHAVYNSRTPYEVLDEVPASLKSRVFELRDLILKDSRVVAVVED